MTDDPKDDARRNVAGERGLAVSPKDTVTDDVLPQDGPMDRAGTEAEADAGMTNEPIPLPDDEPEVCLNRRPDDL